MQTHFHNVFIGIVSMTLLSCASIKPITINSTNARWNDSNKAKTVGFWLYEKPVSCPFLEKQTPTLFGIGDLAGSNAYLLPVFKMSYCWDLNPHGTGESGGSCKSGYLTYIYLPATKQYKGRYKFKFKDGTQKTGEFLADYCEPKPL
jgi:hypothetical protein